MTTQRTKVGEIAGNYLQLRDGCLNLINNLPVEDSDWYQITIYRYYEDDPAAAERRGLIANAKQYLDKLDPPLTLEEKAQIRDLL